MLQLDIIPNPAEQSEPPSSVRKHPTPLRPVKSAAEMTEAELLTTLLGARHESVCATLTSTYDLRALSAAHPLDLKEHGLASSAIERLSVVFELAKRYGETPWRFGAPLRGSSDI